MTIHKQYNEYHELKDRMYAQLAAVNGFSNVLMILGSVYLLYMTVTLFLSALKEPVAFYTASALVWGVPLPEQL